MKNVLENTGTLYHIYQNLARVKIMDKRQKEVLQSQLNDERAVLKSLEEMYKDALNEINSKIEILMARQDAEMQHVIYQVQYQESLKTQIKAILETLQTNEFETVSEYLAKSYEEGFLGTLYSLQGQGVPLIFPIDQAQVADAIQTETKLSTDLYTAMGHDIKDLQKKIAGEISRGIAGGQMYSEIARNIAGWANIPKNNAMRITRTEAHRIQCKAASDAQHKAKSRGADVVKQWDSTLDGRTRDSHRKIDGEIKEIPNNGEKEEPFSNGLMYPGDPSGAAGEVINCRCALLTRARWALDRTETKYLGNMDGMDDEDLQPLADKLHMSVAELRTYQGQIVPINAKSYEDFKWQYDKIWKYEGSDLQKEAEARIAGYKSERVRTGAQKIKNKIVDLQEVTVNGVTYKVDGRHVILDNTQQEKDVANLISEYLEKTVKMVPRVVYPQGVSTPDYMIGNDRYDLKEPVGSGKHVLYNMINKKKSQADNFIFDITNCPLDYEDIKKQIDEIYRSAHTSFVNEIIIVENGKVKEKFNKKRN